MGWITLYLKHRRPGETATEWLLREGFQLLKEEKPKALVDKLC